MVKKTVVNNQADKEQTKSKSNKSNQSDTGNHQTWKAREYAHRPYEDYLAEM